ncbi:hypothetical protein H0H92_012955 [Tricholoma furcatifolium]|nr:hypothetical protein H0H92_012955 [Tricholoma furcatifolium]
MTFWTLRPNTLSRTFERQLGSNELGFYWDSQFSGTADTFHAAIVENIDSFGQNLFEVENVTATWRTLKQNFPLLGAHLEVQEGEDQVFFVVSEDQLQHTGPAEVSFHNVASLADAQAYLENMIGGERLLSNNLLARVVILSRSDMKNHFHVIFHVAHLITDGMSNQTILRSFLDILSSQKFDQQSDLEKNLALAIPSDALVLNNGTNRARLRWFMAVARIISAIRSSKIAIGGHTLPRKFTNLTQYTPAHSGMTSISFSPNVSTRIIANCRKHRITLGNALPVLGQVALARVLCRRYICGAMSAEEWNFRKREPTITGGPLNLRPFLNRVWYQNGGSTNVALVIGFFQYQLPFMPLGSAANISRGDNLPSFQELLSFPRFIYRSQIIQKQAQYHFTHPLFAFIAGTRSAPSIAKFKEVGQTWKDKQTQVATPIPVMEQNPVYAHGGSSIGNIGQLDGLLPRRYPPSAARLLLHATTTRLCCRPAELYLGATTLKNQLHMNVFWDKNVYDADVVGEWLNEVQEATEVFLGDDDRSASARL